MLSGVDMFSQRREIGSTNVEADSKVPHLRDPSYNQKKGVVSTATIRSIKKKCVPGCVFSSKRQRNWVPGPWLQHAEPGYLPIVIFLRKGLDNKPCGYGCGAGWYELSKKKKCYWSQTALISLRVGISPSPPISAWIVQFVENISLPTAHTLPQVKAFFSIWTCWKIIVSQTTVTGSYLAENRIIPQSAEPTAHEPYSKVLSAYPSCFDTPDNLPWSLQR